MATRSYNKKSDYWNNRKQVVTEAVAAQPTTMPTLAYDFDGKEHYTANASTGDGYRNTFSASITPLDRFRNINGGMLPWEARQGFLGIADAILTCQRAYANVAIIRNTIESQVEFSTSKLHIKTANTTVKQFFTEWFNKINLNNFSNQFFREYYRSGNVFVYTFNGKLSTDKFGKMKSVFGSKTDIIPIRYTILNPSQIYLNGGMGYNNNWVKLLSTYEIERLKSPKTEEDRQVLKGLPEDVKRTLKTAGALQNIFIPIDPARLYYVFYKKQDYEPLAIPMIYPVLNDIEWKLELKKMDMSLSRTIEQVILLVTTGEKKDQHGGGINPQNLANLQSIFKNQTIGRVLVADYTTKGEWLIPDIGQILGQEKYKQVDQDIKEGLQSILMGDDKFANAQIKAKVFIERMKEGQKIFLSNFLMPEIIKICKAMNFKHVPEIEFEEINLSDPAVANRLYVQLAQLGILTPDEVMVAMQTGVLPDKESNLINQTEFKKNREDGLYEPMLGGANKDGEDNGGGANKKGKAPDAGGRPNGTKSPQTTKKVGPIGTKASEESFSSKIIAELSIKADSLKELVEAGLKKKFKVKTDLNAAQKDVAEMLAKSIISNELPDSWSASVTNYIKQPKEVNASTGIILDDLAARYDLTSWQAAIVNHAKIKS